MPSVVLLSGGMDSAAVAVWSRPDHALFLDYGQEAAAAERRASLGVAADLGLPWSELSIDCRSIGESTLARLPESTTVPRRDWWPFRNQLIVTLASAWAVVRSIDEILLGTVATDGDQNRDGTAWFIATLDALTSGQEGGIHVRTPAIGWTTEELISASGIGRPTLARTYSCHTGSLPCGECSGCRKREEIVAWLG